jgi:hypothetical protein
MKYATLIAACAAVVFLSLAPVAFAVQPITAKLATPVASKTKLIAGGVMFVCEADACQARAATSQSYSGAACKAIAGKFGPVTSFGGVKTFDTARLDDCNTAAAARLARQWISPQARAPSRRNFRAPVGRRPPFFPQPRNSACIRALVLRRHRSRATRRAALGRG